LRPEWIGVYVNADEIEKQLRHSGALDLNSFDLREPAGVPVTTDRRLDLPQELASSCVAAVTT
jgi:hypothetical protein